MGNKEILQKVSKKIKEKRMLVLAGMIYQYAEQLASLDNGEGADKDTWWETFSPIIFSHQFAQAFWGQGYANIFSVCLDEDHEHVTQSNPDKLQAWQYHLQKMVLEEEPIKYLEKYV